MTAFTLQFTTPAEPEHEFSIPATYNPALQLNVLPDGTPACENEEWLRVSGTTTSTAGSKTHFDD